MAKTKLCWMAVVIAAMGIQASCGSGDGQDREAARCEEEERLAVPGWKLNRDWSCACRLFDPEPGTQLPDWGTWEKCPTLGPKNVDCRMIVPPPEAADASRSSRLMDVHEISGRVTLALTDATRNGGVVTRLNYMVFDADGPTRSAMIQDMGGEDRCDVRWAEMNEGKLALHVFGKNARGSYDGMERTNQAVLGGDPDGPLARLIHKWDPKPLAGWTMSVSVSSDLLVTSTREGGFVAADWATMRWHEVIPDDDDSETDSYDTVEGLTTLGAVNGADPGGATSLDSERGIRPMKAVLMGRLVAKGRSVFVHGGPAGPGGMSSWDPEHGKRQVLLGSDLEFIWNLRTDGKDMVWTRARNKNLGGGPSSDDREYSMMTAPFTTDSVVPATKIRWVRDVDEMFVWNEDLHVGCGHVAWTSSGDLLVIRLSDRAEWIVEGPPPSDQFTWGLLDVVGLTCDEVFVGLYSTEGFYPGIGTSSTARIRLDSLGEPRTRNAPLAH